MKQAKSSLFGFRAARRNASGAEPVSPEREALVGAPLPGLDAREPPVVPEEKGGSRRPPRGLQQDRPGCRRLPGHHLYPWRLEPFTLDIEQAVRDVHDVHPPGTESACVLCELPGPFRLAPDKRQIV